MSKRKVVAGGYEESSDGPEVELEVLPESSKRSKSASYAPICLTTMSKAPGSFQLPQSRSFSAPGSATLSSSQPKIPLQVATSVPSPPLTLSPQSDWEMLDAAAPNPNPKAPALQKPSANSGATIKTGGSNQNTSTTRSSVALERHINAMAEQLEEYMSSNSSQHQETHEQLARLTAIVDSLVSARGLTLALGSDQLMSHASGTPDPRPNLSNPAPTRELTLIIAKVVSEARGRIGKKKGGADDNSLKEHARLTFYRMLKISAAKEIKPYFEDEYGDPDTLPAQFVDPDTNYCMPYPHWKAPLTKQVAWILTFIQRFRATIPNNSSELLSILRDLLDEQIVILLNDGPFRTAQSAWRDLKKSDEEIEGMRKYSRKYQRTEWKATSRGRFIQTIPTLQGPKWEFLSTVGYMSCDESDDEGGLITKRPEYRATWVTNLYRAIEVAQLEKAKSQPGLCPRPPRRTVLMSNLPVPHLERGTGSSKVTIRIAQCAISGSWRKVNAGNLSKFAQSLDSRVTEKPDIDSFLALHPMPNDDDTSADDDANESGQDDQLPLSHAATTESGESVGNGGTTGHTDGGKGKNQDYGRSVVDSELVFDGGSEGGSGRGDGFDEGNYPNGHAIPDSHIDPGLLAQSANSGTTLQEQRQPRPKMRPVLPVSSAPQTSESTGEQDAYARIYNPYPAMPPPPPLPSASHLNPVHAAPSESTAGAPSRQTRSSIANKTPGAPLLEGQSSVPGPIPNAAAVPRKRGRPVGSKNKKKGGE